MSSDEDDSGGGGKCFFGTALPELKDDDPANLRKKPLAIEEQIVTDENGRRRFHGAFTGGFSAGFFNTVGSRDGWTPQHFKSSRSKGGSNVEGEAKPERRQQTANDFMDDEDRGHFGIAPQKIQTVDKFRTPNLTRETGVRDKRRLAGLTDIFGDGGEGASSLSEGSHRAVFDSLFTAPKETVGVRLLRDMGWRPGQGIGPRLHRKSKARRKEAHLRMFGDQGKTGDKNPEEDEEDDEKYKVFLFAPDDIPSQVTNPKDNYFGIGYTGLDRSSTAHVNLFDPPKLRVEGKKKAIVGQAFGVGAFEEEDEDIYGREDIASKYNFYLDDDPDGREDGRSKKKKSRWSSQEVTSQACLEGFSQAEYKSAVIKTFPLPVLPKDFRPVCNVKPSRFEPVLADKKRPLADPLAKSPQEVRRDTEPRERSGSSPKLLEKPTDFTSPTERFRTLVPKPAVATQPTESLDEVEMKKYAEELKAKGPPPDDGSFKPYAKHPEKQLRYEQYLICRKNGKRLALRYLQPPEMTDWAREQEVNEFERAAVLYQKRSNTSIGSRFVSSSSNVQEDVSDPTVGVSDVKAALSEAEQAVKKKFFGPLTREKVEWHPARLLCVRFNVKPPYGDASVVGVPPGYKCKLDLFAKVDQVKTEPKKTIKDARDKSSKETESDAVTLDPALTQESKSQENESVASISSKPADPATDTQKEEQFKKASSDLFKSIFLDDSSSDSESEPEEKREQGKDDKTGVSSESVKSVTKPSVERNPSKGLFANINLDRLNERRPPSAPIGPARAPPAVPEPAPPQPESRPTPPPPPKRQAAADFFQDSPGEEVSSFGPAKPDKPLFSLPKRRMAADEDDEDLDQWAEKSPDSSSSSDKHRSKSSKAKKVKKKSSKKKEKKSKKSKKSKKKKKRSYNSSSSSESD